MTTWYHYPMPDGAHPERPWWRLRQEQRPTNPPIPMGDRWVRSDGRLAIVDGEVRAERITADDLAVIDHEHPLPVPEPRVGQVWHWPDGQGRCRVGEPTEPGWYWWRGEAGQWVVVHLYEQFGAHIVTLSGNDFTFDLDKFGGEWGPRIPEPEVLAVLAALADEVEQLRNALQNARAELRILSDDFLERGLTPRCGDQLRPGVCCERTAGHDGAHSNSDYAWRREP